MIYIATESLISVQLDKAKCSQLLQIKVGLIIHKKTMAAGVILTLAEMQQIIQSTFARWLQQNQARQLDVTLPSGRVVRVDISRDGDMFNCGVPGHGILNNNADLQALQDWVPQAITCGNNEAELLPPRFVGNNQRVNVTLRGAVMFNFHVWLR